MVTERNRYLVVRARERYTLYLILDLTWLHDSVNLSLPRPFRISCAKNIESGSSEDGGEDVAVLLVIEKQYARL